jgi:hypothetical protein
MAVEIIINKKCATVSANVRTGKMPWNFIIPVDKRPEMRVNKRHMLWKIL